MQFCTTERPQLFEFEVATCRTCRLRTKKAILESPTSNLQKWRGFAQSWGPCMPIWHPLTAIASITVKNCHWAFVNLRYLAMVTAFLWWAPPSRNWFEIVLFIAAEVCWSMAAGMADWDPGLPDKESKLDFMKRSRRPTRSTFSELTDIIEVMLFSAVGVERPSSSSSKSDSCKKGGKNYWNCKYIQYCLVSLGTYLVDVLWLSEYYWKYNKYS